MTQMKQKVWLQDIWDQWETGHLIPFIKYSENKGVVLTGRYYFTVAQSRSYFRMFVKQLIIKIVLFSIKNIQTSILVAEMDK